MKKSKHVLAVSALSLLVAGLVAYGFTQAADNVAKIKGAAVKRATGAADTTKGKVEEDRTRFSDVRIQLIESRLAAIEKELKSLQKMNAAQLKEIAALNADNTKQDEKIATATGLTHGPSGRKPQWVTFNNLTDKVYRFAMVKVYVEDR